MEITDTQTALKQHSDEEKRHWDEGLFGYPVYFPLLHREKVLKWQIWVNSVLEAERRLGGLLAGIPELPPTITKKESFIGGEEK